MLKWLLEIVYPHRTNDFGKTALALAAGYDSLEAVDLLLAAGADVNAKLSDGTALSCAGTRAVVLRLLDAGADPLELSSRGRHVILHLLQRLVRPGKFCEQVIIRFDGQPAIAFRAYQKAARNSYEVSNREEIALAEVAAKVLWQ